MSRQVYRDTACFARCQVWKVITALPCETTSPPSRTSSGGVGVGLATAGCVQLDGRLISWRVKSDGRVLELVEQPVDDGGFQPVGLNVVFNDDRVLPSVSPSVTLIESAELLRLLVVTQRHSLHWFDFSLPPADRRARVFDAHWSQYAIANLCPRHRVLTSCALSLNRIALGCETGVVVVVQFLDIPGENVEEVALNERSILNRLLSWRQEAPRADIVALAPLTASGSHLLALSADGSLQVFAVHTRERLLNAVVPSAVAFRVVHADHHHHHHHHHHSDDDEDLASQLDRTALLVYQRSGATAAFLVCRLSPGASRHQQLQQQWQFRRGPVVHWPATAGPPLLLDFAYAASDGGRIWALWRTEQPSAAASATPVEQPTSVSLWHAPLDVFGDAACSASESSVWLQDMLAAPPRLAVDLCDDAQRLALRFIFAPPFSLSVLRAAYQQLSQQVSNRELDAAELRAAFIALAVVQHDSSHLQRSTAWARIVHACVDAWLLDNSPLAVCPLPSAVAVVKDSAASLLRCAAAEELFLAQLRRPHDHDTAVDDLQLGLLKALRCLDGLLTPDSLRNFEDSLAFVAPVDAAFLPVTNLLTGLCPASDVNQAIEAESFALPSASASPPLVLSLGQALQPLIQSGRLAPALDAFIARLAPAPSFATLTPSGKRTPRSDAVAAVASELVTVRFDLLRLALFLVLLLWQLRSTLRLSPAELRALHAKFLPRLLILVKTYGALKWLCARRLRCTAGSEADHEPAALIEAFCAGVHAQLPQRSGVLPAALALLGQLAVNFEQQLLAVCQFLCTAQDWLALEHLLLLSPVDSPLLDYYSGVLHVELGSAAKASAAFVRGVRCLGGGAHPAVAAHVAQQCQRALAEAQLGVDNPLYNYYMAVVHAFSERHFPIEYTYRFIELAVDATSDVELKQALWSRAFLLRLDGDDYLGAYAVLLQFFAFADDGLQQASRAQQITCLERLVAVLCQRRLLPVLMQLPWVGPLLAEVDACLFHKAESSDVNHVPNYYEILFAYRVKQCNYRGAALSMWRYADRLRTEATGRAVLQARCDALAAATSVLRLTHPDNAWHIVVPVAAQAAGQPVAASSTEQTAKRDRYGQPVATTTAAARFGMQQQQQQFDSFDRLPSMTQLDDDDSNPFLESTSVHFDDTNIFGNESDDDDDDDKEVCDMLQQLDSLASKNRFEVSLLADMERQYLLCCAARFLAERSDNYALLGADAKAGDLVPALLRHGAFSVAVSLCQAFKLSYAPVFAALTHEYARLSGWTRDSAVDERYSIDVLVSRGHEGADDIDSCLALLMELLELLDGRDSNHAYLRLVASTLVGYGPLPGGVVELFQRRGAADQLLAVLVDAGRIDEAVRCFDDAANQDAQRLPRTAVNRLLDALHHMGDQAIDQRMHVEEIIAKRFAHFHFEQS